MASDSSDQIQVLPGLEGVRKRPGMFVGSTDSAGLHHLLWELVGNVIDLHLARNANELHVTLGPDAWVTVRDDGPGIPTELREGGISVLETVFTQLHCGATYDGHYPHVHLTESWYGVGLAVVNALSERVEVETTYRGNRWTQAYERGERATPLRRIGPSTHEGTTIRFRPDPLIFREHRPDIAVVGTRLQELAWLNPHLRVVWQERRLRSRGGVLGWAREIAAGRGSVEYSHAFAVHADAVNVDVALAWNQSGGCELCSFVNMQPTMGGAHVDGFWAAFLDFARTRKSAARRKVHVREAIGSGLVAIIHVGMYAPAYASPTRDFLASPEAAVAVSRLLSNVKSDRLETFLNRRLHVSVR